MTTVFRVELEGPTVGFIVGRNVVGQALSPAGAALSWLDYSDSFTSCEIARGGQSDGPVDAVDGGTMTVTLVARNSPGAWFNDLNLAPNRRIRAVAGSGTDEAPIFTGTILDVDVYDTVVSAPLGVVDCVATLHAVDIVTALESVDRFGAVVEEGVGYERFTSRVARLSESSPVELAVREAFQTESWGLGIASWTRPGTPPTGVTLQPLEWVSVGNTAAGIRISARNNTATAKTFGVNSLTARSMLGHSLPAGSYSLRVAHARVPGSPESSWNVRVIGGATITIPAPPDDGTVHTALINFTLASTMAAPIFEAALSVPIVATVAPGLIITDLLLRPDVDAVSPPLGDVAYESSLTNHLSMACNSVGAVWFPTAQGGVDIVRTYNPPVGLVVSDTSGLSYTDLALSHDTRAVKNSLKITNHGRDAETGNAADQTTTFEDDVSVATFGRRGSSIDLSLYLGGPYINALAARASELLTRHASPRPGPRSVTFRGLDEPYRTAVLDVFSRIAVKRSGEQYVCRVNGIRHSITADLHADDGIRWTTTLLIRKEA